MSESEFRTKLHRDLSVQVYEDDPQFHYFDIVWRIGKVLSVFEDWRIGAERYEVIERVDNANGFFARARKIEDVDSITTQEAAKVLTSRERALLVVAWLVDEGGASLPETEAVARIQVAIEAAVQVALTHERNKRR